MRDFFNKFIIIRFVNCESEAFKVSKDKVKYSGLYVKYFFLKTLSIKK